MLCTEALRRLLGADGNALSGAQSVFVLQARMDAGPRPKPRQCQSGRNAGGKAAGECLQILQWLYAVEEREGMTAREYRAQAG